MANNQAFRFEWRQADYDGKNSTKHAELRTDKFTPDLEQWLGFRIYFDEKTLGLTATPSS